ncbi:MAG TPA: hypothetical protein VFF65_10105 [Phycisphaerales bacterium]|nr:hypothetical protein [Phycisphaerales bacterium]
MRSFRPCVSVAAVALLAGVAAADIIPTARFSEVFSHLVRFNQPVQAPPQQVTSTTFAPFNHSVDGANQNTTVSNTTFGGTVNNSPFYISTPHNPGSMTSRSEFNLDFDVVTATSFTITGNIQFEQMNGYFRLIGPGNTVVFTPTYTPSGSPFGGLVASMNFNTVLAPGSYRLEVRTAGESNGAGSPTFGQISFQVNAAPTPGVAATLGLGMLASLRRRRA